MGIPAGSSDLVVLVVADITEHERLRQAEQEFVANASHELRTPIAAIASAVEALKAGAQDEPESRVRFIELIERQSARLTRLTSSLLTLARAQTAQEELQLEPVTAEAAARGRRRHRPRGRSPRPRRMRRAGDGDGASRHPRAGAGEPGRQRRQAHPERRGRAEGPALRAQTRSSRCPTPGPGIPAEAQGRIFDRFFTVDRNERNGFGLGLAIARGSAEAIGGKLTIESSVGEGTTATLVLHGADV